MYIEPRLHPSIVNIMVAMNDKVRKRIVAQKDESNGIYESVDKVTKKIAIHLPEDQSVFIILAIHFGDIVGDTKTPSLRCIPFISKVKIGDIITTGQYRNYQSFTNLELRFF